MENALGEPQTIVLLGGTSDIGLAIVRELLNPTTRTVVLACRDIEKGERSAQSLRHHDLTVDVVRFDAGTTGTHPEFARSLSTKYGDIDVAIVAFSLLGDGDGHVGRLGGGHRDRPCQLHGGRVEHDRDRQSDAPARARLDRHAQQRGG